MRDGDSEEKEAQFFFEAVLSGCELAVSSPREAGVSASLKFWEPLIVPHCYFWSVVCKQEREEVRVDGATQAGLRQKNHPGHMPSR